MGSYPQKVYQLHGKETFLCSASPDAHISTCATFLFSNLPTQMSENPSPLSSSPTETLGQAGAVACANYFLPQLEHPSGAGLRSSGSARRARHEAGAARELPRHRT